MHRQSFIAGTSILIGASLVTRILGFIYRVALTRLIGAEGIGLFQMVFPFLSLILTFVTLGMGVAVSKLVAESVVTGDRKRISRILSISLITTISLSVVFSILMVTLGPVISRKIFTDPRAIYPFITLTPVIAIIAISSVFRGYFQGLQIMSTPSIASIIETLLRIVAVWILATLSLAKGLEFAAAGVSGGMILGELGGCLYMYLMYRLRVKVTQIPLPKRPVKTEPGLKTVRAIMSIAIPVTFSRLIGSLAYAIEPILVTRSLLTAGLSTVAATRAYGEYGGMAIPLLVFPTVFTYSLAIQLVPSISEAVASGNKATVSRRLQQSFRVTALVGLPTSLILLQFSVPLCVTIFHHAGVGALLSIMAPAGFLLYLQGPLSGILQGINKAGIAMRNSLIGSFVKLIIIYLLASNKSIGVTGIAWSVTISVTLTTLLHIASVRRRIGFSVDTLDTAKILLATVLMAIVSRQLWSVLQYVSPMWLSLTTTIFLALLFYIIVLFVTKTITSYSFTRIPGVGKPLARIIRKIPFAR